MVEGMRAASRRSPARPRRMIAYYNRQRPQTTGHGGQDEGLERSVLGICNRLIDGFLSEEDPPFTRNEDR